MPTRPVVTSRGVNSVTLPLVVLAFSFAAVSNRWAVKGNRLPVIFRAAWDLSTSRTAADGIESVYRSGSKLVAYETLLYKQDFLISEVCSESKCGVFLLYFVNICAVYSHVPFKVHRNQICLRDTISSVRGWVCVGAAGKIQDIRGVWGSTDVLRDDN